MTSSTSPNFVLATPSYYADFERCKLLVDSVQTLSKTPIPHYVIVDRRDYELFKPLASTTTEILIAEALLPSWIYRVPLLRQAWFSLKSPPIRNWMIQQMIKISFAKHAPAPTTIFVDSDVVFVRPFSLDNFIHQGKTRLLRVAEFYDPIFEPFYTSTYRLLGIEGYPPKALRPNYIGNLISWRKSNVIALCDRIEQVSGRPWLETLAWAKSMSEYMLYGVFVDQIMGAAAAHFPDWENLCHGYWTPQPMNPAQMAEFFASTPEESIAVMISAKANMLPERYSRYLPQLNLVKPAD